MRLISAALFIASLTLSVFLFDADKNVVLSFESPIQLVVCNSAVEPLPIYTTDPVSDKVLGTLQSKSSLPYLYGGRADVWKYVRYNGATAVIRSAEGLKGIEVYQFFIPLWLALIASLLLGLGSAFLFFMFFFSSQHRQKLVDLERTASYLHNESQQHKKEALAYKVALEREREHLRLQQSEAQKLHEQIKKQKHSVEAQLINADSTVLTRIECLKQELKDEARKEAKTRYDVSLKEMKASYEQLNNKYIRCIAEAKIFGIDFFDKKYENLLKGRQFELFFAKDIMTNKRHRILEWTPDKGFDNSIWVAANSNPDFVIADDENNVFAVECKFRSQYYFKAEDKKHISWASEQQGKNYAAFASKRNIPVYIALGFLGLATKPKCHYFVPLDYMLEKSWSEDVKKHDVQLVCKQTDIYDNYVALGLYSKWLDQMVICI